jgi:hypothetical protein
MTPERIQQMICDDQKQSNVGRASGMPRDLAWAFVGAYLGTSVLGAFGIGALVLLGARAAGGRRRI